MRRCINSVRFSTLLLEHGMTQRELAKELGVTEASVSLYVNGNRIPRTARLISIAERLDTTVDYLVGEDVGEEPLKVVLDEGAFPPERAYDADAGMDIRSPRDLMIPAGGSGVIDTGVHIEIPDGYAGFLKSKSGLNVKHDITSEGVIDAGYQGSICVKLYNHGVTGYQVKRGDKVSQLVISPVMLCGVKIVQKFQGETERGNSGFGSTGR